MEEKLTSFNIFLKTFNSEFSHIKVWFTDQNSQPLEIADRIYVKDYGFLSFAKNMNISIGKNVLLVLHMHLKLLKNLRQIQ